MVWTKFLIDLKQMHVLFFPVLILYIHPLYFLIQQPLARSSKE